MFVTLEVLICGGNDHLYKTMQQKQTYKQGDYVCEEGDLFQRIYTLTVGHCDIMQNGKKVGTMEAGEIVGYVLNYFIFFSKY